MRKYLNKPMERLCAELTAGLFRLRKGYVDAAEALLQIIDPSHEYPYDFVVYRLTGFRRGRRGEASQLMPGKSLRDDLQSLMLDICESFPLKTSDYSGDGNSPLDLAASARRLRVSTKTVQRWQRRGLSARRLIFADGRRKLAFMPKTLDWFATRQKKVVMRAMKFTQLTGPERSDIIRRARRMAVFTHCTLGEVAKRIAAHTGRAVETVRYTLRKYDRDHPQTAIFPNLSAPLASDEKLVVYRCFLNGVSATALAGQYRRTRGSVYRIINEMRAKQLIHQPIDCIYNPQFDLPNADDIILANSATDGLLSAAPLSAPDSVTGAPAGEVSPYFQNLYDVPLLTAPQEHDLFRRYNYIKYRADQLRRKIDLNHVRTAQLKRVETLLLSANRVKNHIIRANLRLVVSIAKKHMGGAQNLFELISDGNISLMRAVEKFDYSRGYRFSTYASWAIMRNFARTVPKERFQMDRFATGAEEFLDIANSLGAYEPQELSLPELRESIDFMLSKLSPRERTILIDHYGLDTHGQPQTFDQLGQRFGISKERVRQIEARALTKLRSLTKPNEA